jgi:hypothetical protein
MKKGQLKIIVFFLLVFPVQLKAVPIERIFVKAGVLHFENREIKMHHFDLAKYETTNEQYASFLNSKEIGANGTFKGKQLINVTSGDLQLEFVNQKWAVKNGFALYPMAMVSYYGAVEFSSWAGGRLPTKMEWIYSAKGGMKNKDNIYAGGNSLHEVGWFKQNSGSRSHKVGEKKPNEAGFYDLSGNVWEWCLNDSLKSETDFCVHMGGSWYAGEQPARLDAHYGNTPTHFSNSVGFRVLFPDATVNGFTSVFNHYQGKPWNNQPQQIPGRLQCELYDLGGEGIAYHDNDSMNNGSGNLNPANGTFLNEFRMNEAVDISYTKARDIDNSPYNKVEPVMNEFYTGWTIPGEWINYTVLVNKTGSYTIGIMYTASGDGSIGLSVDGKEVASDLFIPSTRHVKETIPWRQWHHWNKINSLVTVKLTKGLHVLTLKTMTNGNMNYDYLEFKLVE